MKQFLNYIGKTGFLLVVVAFLLDGLYTVAFYRSQKRNKIEKILMGPAQKYDVVFMGSSRANNHFVPELFEDKGISAFNYGISGSHLFESSLMLKLMLERGYAIKTIVLETDINLSKEKRADGISAYFLPYIHQYATIKRHFETEDDFNAIYYLPFYRYIDFGTKIGFREAFMNAIDKKTNTLNHSGYYPLPNDKKGNMRNSMVNLNPLKNRYYEEIKQICKENNIQLISIMTPICENTGGMDYFDKVKALYPEIHNYENVVKEDVYFSSCGHMNDQGARKFTQIILNDFFLKKAQ